jgi:hypothetical protein
MTQLGWSIMLIMLHENYHLSGKYNGIGRPDKLCTFQSGVVMIQDPRDSTKHGVTSKAPPPASAHHDFTKIELNRI